MVIEMIAMILVVIYPYGRSGYCECGGGRRVMEVSCEHSHFTCEVHALGKIAVMRLLARLSLTTFYAKCGDGDGLAVYPKKGDVYFLSQTPDAHLDPQSFHGGCPIIKGDKWGANVWVWNRKLYLFSRLHMWTARLTIHDVFFRSKTLL